MCRVTLLLSLLLLLRYSENTATDYIEYQWCKRQLPHTVERYNKSDSGRFSRATGFQVDFGRFQFVRVGSPGNITPGSK